MSHEDDTRLPVVAVEVVGNDWHGQAGEERASEGTQHGDHLALGCLGNHISIPNGRHGDERPVDRRRHVDESGRRPHLIITIIICICKAPYIQKTFLFRGAYVQHL